MWEKELLRRVVQMECLPRSNVRGYFICIVPNVRYVMNDTVVKIFELKFIVERETRNRRL